MNLGDHFKSSLQKSLGEAKGRFLKDRRSKFKSLTLQFASTSVDHLHDLDLKRGIVLNSSKTERHAEKFSARYFLEAPRIFLPILLQTARSQSKVSNELKVQVTFWRFIQYNNHLEFESPFPDPAISPFELKTLLPYRIERIWGQFLNSELCASGDSAPSLDFELLSLADPSPLPPSVSSISSVLPVENIVHASNSSSLGISRSGRQRKLNKRFTGEFGRGLKLILRGGDS